MFFHNEFAANYLPSNDPPCPHLTLINFAKGGALELVRHPKKKAIDMIVNETYTDDDLLR